MKNFNFSILLLFIVYSFQLYGQESGYTRVMLNATPAQLSEWRQQNILPAHLRYKEGVLEMELDQTELAVFSAKKIPFTDISKPTYPLGVQSPLRQPIPTNYTYGSMGGFYTYDETMDILDDMRTKFPTLVSAKEIIGTSHEGRSIVAIRISDNPDVKESNEDEWLMTSLHHSNEVLGQQITIYFAWYLLENFSTNKEIRDLLENSALYIVPIVNPDGLAYNESTHPTGGGTWRKNRKPRVISGTTHYGVDLNRNYGYNRAYSHPGQLGQAGSNFAGNDYYRGTAAWSEEETKAIRDFCLAHDFVAAFNYHAWDDSFNYPWNYDNDTYTPDHAQFLAIAQYCTTENNFQTGTFNTTLGYSANGTSDDWMYGEQVTKNKIFPFTIEVGKSFWPNQSLIVPYCDSLLDANIKMLRMAARYASIEETNTTPIPSYSHITAYNLRRYSIRHSNFTVSVVPLDAHIIATEAPKTYTDLDFLESRSDYLSYTIAPGTPNGTTIKFLLKVDNGTWYTLDTITKILALSPTLAFGCIDNGEPNNALKQASQLLPGQFIEALINQPGDEDWYSITNTADKKNIRIVLSDVPEDFDLQFFDPGGTLIAMANRPYKLNDTIVYNAPTAGNYYVRVYGFRKAFHANYCYRLTMSIAATPFAATAAYRNKEQKKNDILFSVFPIPATNQINVMVSSGTSNVVSWVLVDPAGKELLRGVNSVGAGSSLFMIPCSQLSPGSYLLQLTTENGTRNTVKVLKQ